MAWVGLVAVGLIAEVSVIIALGRGTTRRYEIGRPSDRDLLGPRYGATPPEPGTDPSVPPRLRERVDGDPATLPVPRPTPG